MSRRPSITEIPRVGLFLETSTEYGRGLLRGIVRYSGLHGPWSLYVAPGHLEQALPKEKSWSGMGIIARMRSTEMTELISATGVPFVASLLDECGSPRHGEGFGEIGANCPAIAEMAAAHLVGLGLRHFGFCGFAQCPWSLHRAEAFSRYLKNQGSDCDTHCIELANWMRRSNWIQTWEYEQPFLVEWLKALRKPVGVMACNDNCGREVLQACATAGLRVPDEVAVVGVDNDELMCELSNPPLSSVALDLEKAGYEAARLLANLMSGRSTKEPVMVEPSYVVVRQSSEIVAPNDPDVATALRFIKDYANQPISVPSVVERVGVSRRALERRFFCTLGRSILSEITHCRLERAKQLLLQTDLSCERVAAGAGFGSLKTFNRVFRLATGTPPSRFRRSLAA